MTGARWEAVKSVFLEAMTLPPSDRAALLERLQHSDRELYDLVDDLLSASADKGPDLFKPCWLPGPGICVPHALEPGRKLNGRFEIVGFLGAGGLGEVYRAFDHEQSIFVAVKTLHPGLVWDRSAVAMLKNEVNTARSVTHPNVCRLYDFHPAANSDSPPFVTMEFLDGRTVAQRLRAQGPFSTEVARLLVDQMLAALDAAHQKGIVHRDFKTANVMLVDDDKLALVMDFGLAREAKPGRDLLSTLESNPFAGTPAYMSPEQLRGEKATCLSDVHAVGVVLFEMITARLPFTGTSPLEIASRRLNDDAPSPRRFCARLDRCWEYTIIQCLSREPARRPPTVRAIRELLDKTPPFLWMRRRTFLAGAALTATASTAAATVAVLKRNGPVSVNVFDIENGTKDTTLEYLAKGTTSEVVRRLSALENINAIRIYASQAESLTPPAAQFALAGTLQNEDGQPRLSVRLVDNRRGQAVWSRNFGRDRFQDLLSIQSEIAEGAATQLQKYLAARDRPPAFLAWIGGGASGKPGASPTASPVAFDYYLRGNNLLQEASPESVRTAIQFFEKAVAEDSRFAIAYASLSEAHLALRGLAADSDEHLGQMARHYADLAVRLDPTLAEAHAALAAVRQLEWDWEGSEASYNQALRLKPRFPRARRWRAGLVLQFARFDEAISEMQRAFAEDPYDRRAIIGYGMALMFAGRVGQAADFLEKQIGDRELPTARHNLCQAYARLGHDSPPPASESYYQKAFAQAEMVAAIERRTPAFGREMSTSMLALIHSLRGDSERAKPYLYDLERAMDARQFSPIMIAMAYASQNDTAKAMDLVDRSISERDGYVIYLRVNIFLENLRGQPRFQAALRKLRLT